MKKKNGFTLIELLAVIAILGLLVTIAGFSVTSILKKSKTDINDIQKSRMLDAAKLIVMDRPDIFVTEEINCDSVTDFGGIECIDRTTMCQCIITKDGFSGYLDKTDNITGCVFVKTYHSDGSTIYKYQSGDVGEECVNSY